MAAPVVDFSPLLKKFLCLAPIVVVLGFLFLILQSYLLRKADRWGRKWRANRSTFNNLGRAPENRNPGSVDSTAPACPRCGSQMVMRTNRKDGSEFWGCPSYPQCRGTRQV
jgi:hypothetical protein